MATIREIKLRIKSVSSMQKITKAMKLISVSKLRKARQQLENTKPFFNKVEEVMADILSHSAGIENCYFDGRCDKQDKKTGILVLTGDQGLAGGYNHNVFKMTDELIKNVENPVLFVAGHMGKGYFSKKNVTMDESFEYPVQNPSVDRAREISGIILDQFKSGELDEVYVVYTKMVSTITLEPQTLKLLPLNLDDVKAAIGMTDKEIKIDSQINYEPSPSAVFDVLIPKYIKGIVYGTLVEAFTSEQSARMTAMDSASTNASDMLQRLSLYYNRARQAAITQEISEIVGGAAAL